MKKILTTYGKLLYIGLFVVLYGVFRYEPTLTEQWYSIGLYPYIYNNPNDTHKELDLKELIEVLTKCYNELKK